MRSMVILGAGYAGLAALRILSRRTELRDFRIELIDASGFHTIKTRFHEMLVTRKKDFLIRYPIEPFTRAAGAAFVKDEVRGVDFRKRVVTTGRGTRSYDVLLVTLGGQTNYFGVPGAARYCGSLQTYEAAAACRERIERLDLTARSGPERRVIVCRAGIEGVEVAAMIGRHARPGRCRVTVLEKGEGVMGRSQVSDAQRAYIRDFFESNHISLRTQTAVTKVQKDGVRTAGGGFLPADLVIWCSGVKRAGLRGLGASRPFLVNGFLQHAEHGEVFATGDVALVDGGDGTANLLSAQRALYQARVMAGNVVRRERGRPLVPAAYRPAGELVALGEWDGVGVVGGLHVEGRPAALMKKANEARYLAELFRDVPGSVLRGALPRVGRERPWKTG